MTSKPIAVITGSSSGIGLELAKIAANEGYHLVLAADTPFDNALHALANADVESIQVDLSASEGVAKLEALVGERAVDVLCANAGHGLGKAFLDQSFGDIRDLIDTNVTGTLEVLHRFGRRMTARGSGRVLITGSTAGFMPGAYQAAYDASKAFINSFSYAIRNEWQDSGVTVTCLMPVITESEFWKRGGTLDTKAGSGKKDTPDLPARAGWDAMMAGKGEVTPGVLHTLQKSILKLTPAEKAAEMNAKDLRPGGAEQS